MPHTNTKKITKQIIYLPEAGSLRIGDWWRCATNFEYKYRDVIFHMCERPKQILQNNTIHNDFKFLFVYLFVYTLLLSLRCCCCAGDAFAIVFRPFSHKCDSLAVNRMRANANTRRLFINCKCIKRADWMGLVLNECVRTFPSVCLCIRICIFAQIVERSASFMCTQKRMYTHTHTRARALTNSQVHRLNCLLYSQHPQTNLMHCVHVRVLLSLDVHNNSIVCLAIIFQINWNHLRIFEFQV